MESTLSASLLSSWQVWVCFLLLSCVSAQPSVWVERLFVLSTLSVWEGRSRVGFKDLERAEVFQRKPSKPLCLAVELILLQCYESGAVFRFCYSSQKLVGLRSNWPVWSYTGCNVRSTCTHFYRLILTSIFLVYSNTAFVFYYSCCSVVSHNCMADFCLSSQTLCLYVVVCHVFILFVNDKFQW